MTEPAIYVGILQATLSMAPVRFKLGETLFFVTLVTVYLGILTVSLRGASGAEILGWIIGVFVGSLMFFTMSIAGGDYAQRRAAPVLLALPIAFPWKMHIAAAGSGLILSLLFAEFSKPSAVLGGSMTAACGLLFLTLINRTAFLCKGGVVYIFIKFPWSAVSPVYDSDGTLRFLRLGRSWRGLCITVPPESSKVTEAILHENTSRGGIKTTAPNSDSGSDASHIVAVSTTADEPKSRAFPSRYE